MNRKILTDNQIIQKALNILGSENEEIQIFAIRAIANICFDNESSSLGM